jgi:hypothetical protein
MEEWLNGRCQFGDERKGGEMDECVGELVVRLASR